MKPKFNYVLDIIMGVFLVFSAFSAIVIFFFLKRGGPQEFLGIHRGYWADIHIWTGLVFIVLALIHFFIHWKWIKSMTKNLFVKKEN